MKLPSFLRTPPPHVAVEIAPTRVVAVAVTATGTSGVKVTGWAVEPLTEGAVVPSLTAVNVTRPADVSAAIERVWGQLGQRPKRVALVIPDAAAKVSLVRFQAVPPKASDLEELIKFQIRKAAPFRVEDSQVSYAPGERSADGQDFVVVQARRDIITEYEQVCLATDATPGIVELTTFGLSQCAFAASGDLTGDWLLIHARADGATLAIFRGEHLVFFRHRGADGDGHLGELVHQTAMYYQDRLGGRGFSRVLAGGTPASGLTSPAWLDIQARLGVRAETVDPGPGVTVTSRAPWTPDTMELAAPALGLVLSLCGEG
jgi:type IV pilus assembly protein PilM